MSPGFPSAVFAPQGSASGCFYAELPRSPYYLTELGRARRHDIQADAGIMVTTIGYSDAALECAAAKGIETWVLRPARLEDWEGYIRSMQLSLRVWGVTYRECRADLVDGRVVDVSPLTLFRHPAGEPPMPLSVTS